MAQKTKLEIIDETVAYYTEDTDRRSVAEDGYCKYVLGEKRCAFSRCCTDEGVKILSERFEGNSASRALNILGDSILKEEYRGHNTDFWNDIQDLHDKEEYFFINELSQDGKAHVQLLKEKHSY